MLPSVPRLLTPLTIAAWIVFIGLLMAACVTDVRSRRIPNRLVLLLSTIGFVQAVAFNPAILTPLRAVACFAIGLAIWLPFYAFRMLGAGDVKLFAAASVWLAPMMVVRAALLSALIGGVLGLVWYVQAHGIGFSVVRLAHAVRQPRILREPLSADSPRFKVPYGVAMAAGLIVTVVQSYVPSLR